MYSHFACKYMAAKVCANTNVKFGNNCKVLISWNFSYFDELRDAKIAIKCNHEVCLFLSRLCIINHGRVIDV